MLGGIVPGSLDHPPLIVRSSRWKALATLAVGLVFGFFWGRTNPHAGAAWDFAFHWAIAALIVGFGVFRLIKPSRLELSPTGLVWFTGIQTVRYAWSDFSGFAVETRPKGGSYAGFTLAEKTAQRSAFSALSGSLGGGWDISVEELVVNLNDARRRWTTAPLMKDTLLHL